MTRHKDPQVRDRQRGRDTRYAVGCPLALEGAAPERVAYSPLISFLRSHPDSVSIAMTISTISVM